ncbi:hypothetical protein LAZ67_4001656 [Cordylochernes scorpioides]|uniref:RNA-directed DNA polymerase n=1 Tax=Cordylochernes scorpioides TaxID=51811 RepID=A0ABY6KC47_9ARAC|nr:hypothetical protein LAZ67_4001656 [Cordylochernes scorpioides]
MLQLPLKRLRFNQSSPFKSNNKKPRNDIATERLSRQDSEMELNQDPTGIKSDGPTETMERRQEVRESESARERQEMTDRETTAPLADAVTLLSTLLTRAKISDGTESAIPPFDGTYSATQFFQTFDRKMEDASMGEQEKLLRLPNYLVRQPLELFRKLRLADRSYFQVRQILLDLYPEPSEASFAKYFAMKLTGQANLEIYYREKTAMGLLLGLPQEVILETLTEGLPFNDQRVVRVVPPENLGEWFRLVQRIHGPSVHGMHLFRRPTASSAARDTGTANADVDQSRRPTKKSGQCKRSQNHQFRLHHNQVKPETPQPDSPFETEVGSLNQLTVKLFLTPNVSCPFLIDTGASLSIVPYSIYHMLKTHLPNLTLEGQSLHLQTLNGFAKTMGKLAIPLTIGQISRKEYFHVVNAPLPFGILSINSLHKFRLTIDFNKCTILQLGAPLSTLSYHFNHVSNVCTYWQCQAMSQKIFPTYQLAAYDNHCVHSLRKPHLSTCPFFTKPNCPFYMPSNNQTTTTSTYEPVQNAPTQRDNSHIKNIGNHTPLQNSHMTNPHNELDTHTNTQQKPLPHTYYNTTPNTHYTPQFTTLLQRYTHIFSQDKFNVPCLRIPPVKIPTNSEKIITIRPYRVPICDQQEIRNQIQQMLENGIIEQSFSPFSSPVTLVTKRDKTKRFCIDYRKVNELISSDVHPLPRIEDILDRLAQAKYFSTADISSAYWQVPIHPDSRPLLAFATFEGLYQPTRLPFGLKTSPQIYERAISQVLQRHGLDCVAHYFDDFIIYSNTLEEHQNHLRQFFAFCEAERLQLNFAKCEFFKQSINFLGYTITAGTITPLTRNTDIIHAIKQPHNRKTLQSFLGAVNVYNKFIPEYARLRAPLNNLLKKDVVWNWNEACQEAFIDLKGNLTQHPILHLYKEGLPCQVYCDASTLGIAGILKQVHPDGNVYPVQYFSRTLRPHEKNYSISELECLAIVESVEKFRIYLMGRKFTIFSDHHALQWLKTIKNPSGRLFRWSLRLSSYEYEVRYIKGKLQYEADLLSRNPFCGFLDATLIKTHQSPPSKESSLTIDHNGLHTVSRKGVTKIILPKPLIQQLLQTVHTQYNHPGISQMSRIISTQYYWQGMSKDIKQKVKTCPTCQLTKRPVGPTYGELSQPPESKEPFDLLSLDTIAGFAKYGNTKIYLHVVVDHFSRYAWAFPSKSTSTTTYQQVLKRVFQDGSPKRLLTDRAPAFTSPKFRSFLLNRNIHPLITTSNNPQANGLCERLNATLTGKLRLLHLENPKVAWTKLVKKVTLIYNKTPHSTTGFPPIYLMFGILPPEISNHNTPYPDIDKARKIAHTRTQNKHLQDKNTYDKRHKQPHFEVGDLVLVKLYHHPNTGKLAPYFTGPHTILEIISPNVVRIDRPNQPLQRDTDTIHVNKLKLYTEKIHYISPPAVNTYHIKHNPNYTFPFKHLTPELFPTESLRCKPTSSEPFRHLDPAIFATRRFTSLFPDVKNCKPDNQFNHITPLPKDLRQENCEPTNHSNSTIHKDVFDNTEVNKVKMALDTSYQSRSYLSPKETAGLSEDSTLRSSSELHSMEVNKSTLLHIKKLSKVLKLRDGLKTDQYTIACKRVQHKKTNSEGQVVRYKALLVAEGFSQQKGVNYDENYASVSSFETTRLLTTIGVEDNWFIDQYAARCKSANLYGEIDQVIFMEQPEGYVQPEEEHLFCKLKKVEPPPDQKKEEQAIHRAPDNTIDVRGMQRRLRSEKMLRRNSWQASAHHGRVRTLGKNSWTTHTHSFKFLDSCRPAQKSNPSSVWWAGEAAQRRMTTTERSAGYSAGQGLLRVEEDEGPLSAASLNDHAYGKHALSIKSCEYWFQRFKSSDFDTRDKERGGRPIKFEDAELEALLDEDSSQTQEELAETLGVTQQAISNRLKVMARKHRAPYLHCELLLKRQNRKGFFLHRIVTGDEKWIHYDNPKRRKSWVKPGHASTSTAKPNIHGKKLMLCIWWDQLGVIYYELLQPNETITGERYQQQLMRLSRALKIKRPLYAKRHDKVIYQHDNARPHVAKVVKETLEALQWDVLPHPLYSPDIAPSDYHMFRSMTHGLAEQHFTSYEEAKIWVNVWIASKDEESFRHGIRMLPERWEKVVAKDGQYVE